jgi:hypothetical protein
VWLRLLHRATQSLHSCTKGKLEPRYAGPFRVQRIGSVAYRPQLPESAQIHDVFHINLLKQHRGGPSCSSGDAGARDGWSATSCAGQGASRPASSRHMIGPCSVARIPEDDATWENHDDFRAAYPNLQLKDELFEKAGRDVMYGQAYTRRNRASG